MLRFHVSVIQCPCELVLGQRSSRSVSSGSVPSASKQAERSHDAEVPVRGKGTGL